MKKLTPQAIERFFRKNQYLVVVIMYCIAVLALYPFVVKGFIFNQDDFLFHSARLDGYYQTVSQGDLFPKLFLNMANGYGYLADLFYPSILLLPYALFSILGLSHVTAYFFFLILINCLTFLFSYFFYRAFSKKVIPSIIFASIYTTATYRLIDLLIRGALGESLAFCFLPLVFWGVYEVFFNNQNKWYLLTFGMTLLLLSHMISAFLVFWLILGLLFYCLITRQFSKKRFVSLTKATFLTCLLSVWVILPILEQSLHLSFNFSKKMIWAIGLEYSMSDFFLNSLSSNAGVWSNLKPNIGIFLLFVLIVSIVKYPTLSKKMRFITILAVIVSVLSTNLFPWFPFKDTFFGYMQFPWRILLLVTFFCSILATHWLMSYTKLDLKAILFIFTLIVGLTLSFNFNALYNFEKNNVTMITDENYAEFQKKSIGGGREYLIKDTDYNRYADEKNRTPLLIDSRGTTKIQTFTENEQILSFRTTTSEKGTILFPRLMYYGYQATVNGKKIPVKEAKGLVSIEIEPGTNSVSLKYQKTPLQIGTFWLSFLTLLVMLGWFFIKKRNRKQLQVPTN